METFKTIESNCEESPFEILKIIRINNINRVVIRHKTYTPLGANFIR